ncbi:hypothetical protein NliqN6_1524 [Naganishia liquefaciens]|uniref:Uncharacterized protein n=1 Tax=Naganishia liquefaciens TaxID=104408 RepID=A0A8H3YED2_9TREE|nr:hypothetical protein NliqN6_1524 [Naganishia liquefaciens]
MTTFQIQNIALDCTGGSIAQPGRGSKVPPDQLANSDRALPVATQAWPAPRWPLCANEIRQGASRENLVHVNLKRKYIIQRDPLDERAQGRLVPLRS